MCAATIKHTLGCIHNLSSVHVLHSRCLDILLLLCVVLALMSWPWRPFTQRLIVPHAARAVFVPMQLLADDCCAAASDAVGTAVQELVKVDTAGNTTQTGDE